MIMFPTIPRYFAWTPQDTTLPQLYWNVYSNEQRIHAICRELGKVIRYADMMGVEVSNIAKAINDIQEGKLDEFIVTAIAQWFEDNQPQIMQDIADINALIGDGFTSENTITDAITDINAIIGNGFTSVNTVTTAVETINALIGNGFTSENTVTAAVEAINDELQTFEETTNSAIDELDESAEIARGQRTVEPLLLGCMVFSKQNGLYDHPGSICSNGTTQYIYSQPQVITNNNAHSRVISIQNNEDNANYQNVALAHCNSAAYDENDGYIYVAPTFDYSGGSEVAANYICKLLPNSTTAQNIATPEWIMGVSFDSVANKLYALAYSGMIYEIDETAGTFTAMKQTAKRSNDEYNQDFAIHNGYYCISSPDGFMLCGSLDSSTTSNVVISRIDSSYLFEWGELDGMEFNEYGNLLAIAHSDQLDDRPTFVYELPVFGFAYPMYDYMIQPTFAIGTVYTLNIDQGNTTLRTDGFTAAKALKSFNFLNILADDVQRSIVLVSDYTCENFRLGNNTYNWISFNGHTLHVTNQMTVQTPVIFNGNGTLHLAKAIAVTFGIVQIGFYNLNITIDTGSNLLASNPAGALVFFGPVGTLSPAQMKVNSARTAYIASSQVYYLGTLTE